MATPRYKHAEKLDRDALIEIYRQMYLLRRFEEKSAQQYGLQKIGGFCHLYIGQEAVAVGAEAAIRADDYVITAYRDHGHALARGTPAGEVMAEMFGKATGCAGGKGGSMHLYDIPRHFYGGWGIVGAQIPLGLGMAWASRYKGEDRVTLCYFGEAAVNQGAFHETLNMAALYKSPCIFICENNMYGMGTPIGVSSSVTEVYKRGSANNVPGEAVDGMDVLAMYDAIKRAADRARAGEGPTLIEAQTYRYRGHSMSDPAVYRTREEVDGQRDNDPIPKLRDYMIAKKMAKAAEFEAIEEKINQEVEDSVKFAEESPYPDASELYTDIYVDPIRPGGK